MFQPLLSAAYHDLIGVMQEQLGQHGLHKGLRELDWYGCLLEIILSIFGALFSRENLKVLDYLGKCMRRISVLGPESQT